ncbi:MAG: glycosyltransferase [Clostridia bacterium]|nr:glycosyltransferase [Clostridia bacterium]
MIKLLHFLSDSNIGGAGTLLLNYLANADRDRFAITVALPRDSALAPRVRALGIRVIETEHGRDCSYARPATREFRRIIRAEKPDIVHTHSSLSAKLAAWQCGVGVRIYTRHSVFPPPRKLTTFPGKQISGLVNNTLSTHIIAVAQAAADNLTDTGVDARKIRVIVNGVEPMTPPTAEARRALRASLGWDDGHFVVGMSARLEEVKGHRYFLDAAAQLAEEAPAMRFLIIGTGACEADLRAQAERLGIADRVCFAGFVTNVADYVSSMDLVVNCSFGTEATSLALAEAMSLSRPIVATTYGGNPYMVEDGVNGYLVPIKDAPALAEAVLRVYRDSAQYDALCAGALARYHERFTAAAMTRQMEALYTEALGGKSN